MTYFEIKLRLSIAYIYYYLEIQNKVKYLACDRLFNNYLDRFNE